ncbi:MAG: hypothetical protein RIM84_20975 [Alphaproteobacteria bacterium]
MRFGLDTKDGLVGIVDTATGRRFQRRYASRELAIWTLGQIVATHGLCGDVALDGHFLAADAEPEADTTSPSFGVDGDTR